MLDDTTIETPPEPSLLQMMTIEASKTVPFSIDRGDRDGYRSGATCPTTSEPTNQHPNPPRSGTLLVWSARRLGGVWDVVKRDLRLKGATITQGRGARYTTPSKEFFPDGGGTNLCGAPVTPWNEIGHPAVRPSTNSFNSNIPRSVGTS